MSREVGMGLEVEGDGEDGVVLRESDIHSLEDPEGNFVPWLVGVVLEEPPLAILEGLCTRQGGVVDGWRGFDEDESLGESANFREEFDLRGKGQVRWINKRRVPLFDECLVCQEHP